MADFDLEQANDQAKERLTIGLKGEGAHLKFADAIKDFPTNLRDTKPNNVPYTFWHQLDHIRITQWDILRYVIDTGHTSPSWPSGYWRATSEQSSDESWDACIEHYYADLEECVALVGRDDVNVLEPVAHNSGRSILGSMLILIDHTSYHLGEFVMGRQILGAWKTELG